MHTWARLSISLLLVFFAALASGCGNKGDLYLPETTTTTDDESKQKKPQGAVENQ